MSKKKLWGCPDCGHPHFEKYTTGLTIVTRVNFFRRGDDESPDEPGYPHYGDYERTEGDGDEEWYQCCNCNHRLTDDEILEQTMTYDEYDNTWNDAYEGRQHTIKRYETGWYCPKCGSMCVYLDDDDDEPGCYRCQSCGYKLTEREKHENDIAGGVDERG